MKSVIEAMGAFALCATLAGCNVRYDGEDSVTHQFGSDYFGAGGMLQLTDAVEGDAFLAGGRVSTAAEVKGDLVAVGGEVAIGGSVGDDLYVAGGDVKVDAIVTGNARVAGGDVALGPATVIAGALSLTGGRIEFDGDSHGYLQASGGQVRINGTVHGDAEVRTEDLSIGPDTRIGGKLIVHGPEEPALPAGAEVLGGIEFHEMDAGAYFRDGEAREHVRTVAHGVGSFLWIVGVFLVGMLFTLVFPGYSGRAADFIGREPLKSLGLGFVVLVCMPVLVVVLLVTIVGIPLALILMPLYLLLLLLGWVTAASFIGRKGLAVLRNAQPATTGVRVLAFLVAVLALWLVGRLPYVGHWVTFIALLVGIGALVWQAGQRREAATTPGVT